MVLTTKTDPSVELDSRVMTALCIQPITHDRPCAQPDDGSPPSQSSTRTECPENTAIAADHDSAFLSRPKGQNGALLVPNQRDEGSNQPQRESRFTEATLRITPSVFSMNMGTGIVSILLYNFPYPAEWLRRIAEVIFALNVVLFVALLALTAVRYIRWNGVLTLVNTHTVSGMFWGCLPMGLTTIINMIAFVLAPIDAQWAYLALTLWWLDVALSLFVNLGMIFTIFTRQKHSWETVSSVWLLPIVSSVVAAATGGNVASSMTAYNPQLARSTLIAAYMVWGTGVPLAGIVITIWFARTAILGLPDATTLCSVFLPLGPCGQGSFGIMILGKTVRTLAYEYNTPLIGQPGAPALTIGDVAWAAGILTGLILWGLGLCWYILGHAAILDHVLRKDRTFFHPSNFHMGMWALTFPLGVFASATYQLASDLDSDTLRVIGALQAVQVVCHWLYVMVTSGYKVWDRTLFVAPELEEFDVGKARRWVAARKERHSGESSIGSAV